jgi:DNA-binding transcriptional regulator YdaS (Cro superfamily)
MATKVTKPKTAAEGIAALLSLGYTQAQLARMFDVDVATVSQWVKFKRIGEWRVGRANFIPEFQGKITARDIRPDLSEDRLQRTHNEAAQWNADKNRKLRAREAPFTPRSTRALAKRAVVNHG